MKLFLVFLMTLAVMVQPMLHAEEKTAAASGSALKAAGVTPDIEEGLGLSDSSEDLEIVDDFGLEEELEEDEFGIDEETGTVDLEDSKY